MDEKGGDHVKEMIRPSYLIPSNRTIDKQLRGFQQRKTHQALVQDSSGDIVGLISLEDILEELVGSIQDEHDY
jgi:Mg2+/Co2+ transporter CorB